MTNLYDDSFKQKEDDLYAKRAKEDAVINRKLILAKAIHKAIDGGYYGVGNLRPGEGYLGTPPTWEIRAPFGGYKILRIVIVGHMSNSEDYSMHPNEVIFSHDFAKALWDDDKCNYCKDIHFSHDLEEDRNYEVPAWQYHLQQMVIADDPIKYLGEHLDAG